MREETDLRLGIEADYVAGREDRIAAFLEAREWDYVIGSVHFVRDAAVDLEGPEWEHVWGRGEPARPVWQRYFETLAEAARSGLYDIMAHPDLVKVWGAARPAPERDPRHYYEPAVEAMLDAGVAMEVSTAGLRKPVGELYPAPRAAGDGGRRRAADRALVRRPRARPARLPLRRRRGRAADAGVTELCVFEGRDAADGAARLMVRTGLGVDTTRFAPGPAADPRRRRDPARAGLAGHSDADVLTHAVIDALLGAAGLGDIGSTSPTPSRSAKDADSLVLLRDGRRRRSWRPAGRSPTSTRP